MSKKNELLAGIKTNLDKREGERFSPWACLSRDAVRLREEEEVNKGHRQNFSVDTDRILHSLAYSRYIDKTQVFYLIKNDHITHRVLHVQLVSKIARTVGRLLRLNEDLIEAIALGHDIGHTPFGHDGERLLSGLCKSHNIGEFFHNIQGVRFLQDIERKGRGWNLSLQVLDGIFCHNGEVYSQALTPQKRKDFVALDHVIGQKIKDASLDVWPMTLEGCVVRMADTISYIGRDIEDAIRLGLIKRKDLPGKCTEILGDTNGTIVYTLVEDLVANSLDKPSVKFSAKVGTALKRLKQFNEREIYRNKKIKDQMSKIDLMFELLFKKYLCDLETGNEDIDIFRGFLNGMSPEYKEKTSFPEIVRDFMAGMTDEYFLNQCQIHLVPQRKTSIA